MRKQPGITVFSALAAAICVLAPSSLPAQTYKADDIIKHFQPATPQLGVTRGLCVGTEAECNRAGHAVATKPPAAFDLVVKFKYNSDVLEPEAKLNLDEFAKALKDPKLSASSFMVEGHTDATGSASYNLDLSERRANSVVRYLSERGIDSSKLIARGYGQTKPVAADPYSGDNRRVETRLRVE